MNYSLILTSDGSKIGRVHIVTCERIINKYTVHVPTACAIEVKSQALEILPYNHINMMCKSDMVGI